jgi:very-short-patch-repair endonuclease
MSIVFNNKAYTARRRALRRSLSKAEAVLWLHLSRKQMNGLKFRRQYSVNQYVIDFFCPELKLAIEVYGDSHYGSLTEKYDNERQKYIESFSIHFMRFINDDVYNNIDGVLQTIYDWTERYKDKNTPPHIPSSMRRG